MKSGYKQTQVGVIPEKWKIGGPGTGNTFWQYVLTTPKTSPTTPIAGYRSAFTRTASEQHARRGLSSCSRIPQQPAPRFFRKLPECKSIACPRTHTPPVERRSWLKKGPLSK